MSETTHLLFEIGTEELPPRSLNQLGRALFEAALDGLDDAELAPDRDRARWYATPRRLTLWVPELKQRQADRVEERLGPALAAAFDEQGQPTQAAQGFARSCGVEVEALEHRETDKGERLAYRRSVAGSAAAECLPELLGRALDSLPVPRPMRWGSGEAAFVRPVHWVVLLLGNEVVDANFYGQDAGRESRGHRFHHPEPVAIEDARAYVETLRAARVIVDPAERRAIIRDAASHAATKTGGRAVVGEDLVEEVANLVEWPVAITGSFDEAFLEVPQEALISSMESHQRFFSVVDENDRLLPHFIAFANIESSDPAVVQRGLERVITPRLADARFFWDQDRKRPLAERRANLEAMIYQRRLGTLWDRCQRVRKLAAAIAAELGESGDTVRRAAELAKCDLATEMVYEFPELQGIMGRYYALHDGEDEAVAWAVEEHYLPRFAGDRLPSRLSSRILGIADRLDTLCGIFAAGLKPSGNKDPYALRRAALGLIRLLVEDGPELDLAGWIEAGLDGVSGRVDGAGELAGEVLGFVMERLRAYYADQGVQGDSFEAVWAQRPTRLKDFHARVLACQMFRVMEPAAALAAANKRIGNILRKASEAGEEPAESVDESLLESGGERALHEAIVAAERETEPLISGRDYQAALVRLAELREDVDRYFDEVMVMVEDKSLRRNRLALLARVKGRFDRIADISHLQVGSGDGKS